MANLGAGVISVVDSVKTGLKVTPIMVSDNGELTKYRLTSSVQQIKVTPIMVSTPGKISGINNKKPITNTFKSR